VKSNIKALLSGDFRSAFGIFHENHTTRRGEHASLETFQDSIGGSVIATPVVGVDDEAAARRLLNVRFRQLNLAGPLDL
jgi:hypothetical protein